MPIDWRSNNNQGDSGVDIKRLEVTDKKNPEFGNGILTPVL